MSFSLWKKHLVCSLLHFRYLSGVNVHLRNYICILCKFVLYSDKYGMLQITFQPHRKSLWHHKRRIAAINIIVVVTLNWQWNTTHLAYRCTLLQLLTTIEQWHVSCNTLVLFSSLLSGWEREREKVWNNKLLTFVMKPVLAH